jgi:ribosomal protein S18 acetylase RimI-like enzyme
LKIHVASKEEILLSRVGEIIATNQFLPYSEYGIPTSQLVDYIIEDIHDSIKKSFFVFLAEENKKVVGILVAGKLEWDSKHFGIDIANIKYLFTSGDYYERKEYSKKLVQYFAEISKFKLLITRSHTEDTSLIHALEDQSFQLMDTLVTYYFDLKNKITDFKETCKIEPLKDETLELTKIAKISFSETKMATDHFHADHRLDEAKSDTLYEKWIEEASSDKDSIVLVAKMDNHPVGFTTGKINYRLNSYSNKKIGSMILSAVDPKYRQAQIYTSMIQAGLRWFSNKAEIVDLGTHVANYSVQRAWSKLGFRIVRSQHTWHKWIE